MKLKWVLHTVPQKAEVASHSAPSPSPSEGKFHLGAEQCLPVGWDRAGKMKLLFLPFSAVIHKFFFLYCLAEAF